jgi:hypothetical protein
VAKRRYERSSDSEKYHPPSASAINCILLLWPKPSLFRLFDTQPHTKERCGVVLEEAKEFRLGSSTWGACRGLQDIVSLTPALSFRARLSSHLAVSGPRVEARTVSGITFALTTIRKSLSGSTQNAWITLFWE